MSCKHNVDIEAMKDCPGCLRERVDDAEPKAIAFKSLLVELWDGVRIHGLKAPQQGKDGERLIHAYCGGIAELRNRVDQIKSAFDDRVRVIELQLEDKRQLQEKIEEVKRDLSTSDALIEILRKEKSELYTRVAEAEKTWVGISNDRDTLAHALEWLWSNVKFTQMTPELRMAVERALAVPKER